jgi:hypothetical protein
MQKFLHCEADQTSLVELDLNTPEDPAECAI